MENFIFTHFAITSSNISPEDPLLVINPKTHESLTSYFRGALCTEIGKGKPHILLLIPKYLPLSSKYTFLNLG